MKKTFFPRSVNSVGYTLRQPYKIALCVLVNAVLLVFCFMEGGQWLLANSAIAEAMDSRLYIGYLEPVSLSYGTEETPAVRTESGRVSEDALAYLESSPYVRDTHPIRAHSAKLDSTIWMPGDEEDANNVFMFVGRVRGEPMNKNVLVGRSGSEERETINEYRRTIYPLCVTAGHKKHLAIPPTEKSGLPILVIRDVAHYLLDSETGEYTTEIIRQPDPGLNEGERCLFVAKTSSTAVGEGSAFELYDYTGIMFSEENRYDRMIYREQPGDEVLSDEEFGEKAVRALGLEEYAAVLDRAEFLVTVQETDATDTMVLRQREALRIMTGRELTKKDIGKNVCMMFVSDAADQGLRVGSTVRLAMSDRCYSGTYHGYGVPMPCDTEVFDYGPEEEFEVVGIYTYTGRNLGILGNDAGAYLGFMNKYRFPRGTVFIPTRKDSAPVEDGRLSTADFSFSVHKNDSSAFLNEATDALEEMGYRLEMIIPDYAQIDAQLETLEKNSETNVWVGLIGLVTGLTVSIALPLLFWRKDYAAERRMGAGRREARGVYRSAWFLTAGLSLPLAALALFVLSRVSGSLFPDVLRSLPAVGVMTLFAAAELMILFLCVLTVSVRRDRRQFAD